MGEESWEMAQSAMLIRLDPWLNLLFPAGKSTHPLDQYRLN